jgi:hypothetical protein
MRKCCGAFDLPAQPSNPRYLGFSRSWPQHFLAADLLRRLFPADSAIETQKNEKERSTNYIEKNVVIKDGKY